MKLAILTFVLGLTLGHSIMSRKASNTIDVLVDRSITLAQLSYIEGCVDQGGKYEICKVNPHIDDFSGIINDPIFEGK